MKLKDIVTKYKTAFIVAGAVALLVGIWLAWAYFGASSTVNVPKGTAAEANANAAQQRSATAETQANDIRDQRVTAHTDTARSKTTLKERKAHYEKTRNTANSNGVSDANLDVRERVLQSDLERLYPSNR